ncbi:cobalamin biosynthesis protein [Paraburkholderia caribensis]|uniref:cobalamin biosynthesis protein n=1 Tax=Paraburkholderia caribensis TaxID=75105 RepID=UPI00078EC925|nr:cobalamin biosynthesis protein [Paraburkholderia caribensis]AMV45348.1 cobalamin biosynthesis protein CbiG [Paraburkholderia caribensis]
MKALIAGIGCRRGVSAEQIEAAVRDALGGTLPFAALTAVASVDTKAGEPGLIAFCARHALPLQTFTRAAIAALDAPVAPSPHVRAHLGINGVCEPCALLAAPGGELLVRKQASGGVTVAIACAAAHPHSTDTTRIKEHR